MAVPPAAEIDERGHARRADGYVDEAQTPRAAERIADDDSEAFAGLLAQAGGQAAGGTVGVFRQECDEIVATDVRMVHACIGADEAVMCFDNQDPIRADDAAGFAEDYFDKTRIIGKFFRQGNRLGGRLDRGQTQDAPFRFRNNFLSEDQNISVLKLDFRATSGEGRKSGQVVALANFRETGNDEERNTR